MEVRLDVAVVVDMDAVGTVVDPVDDMLNEYICDSMSPNWSLRHHLSVPIQIPIFLFDNNGLRFEFV